MWLDNNGYMTIARRLRKPLMIGETASGVVAVIRRKQQRRHRLAHGLCLTCGYSLAGNISGVCPECGTPVIDT